ncbi:MAG: tetratricopeptide repeat protein [Sedimentisphaerales bacterium]|nr:tetratricopeptide repeat protein [Sedimentisphaerales bacterium]
MPVWKIALSALALTGISMAAVVWRRRIPYLFVGWFWYMGMLVPVIGLVQICLFAMADRFTYLLQIGLYISLTWGIAQITAAWRHRRLALGVISVFVLFVFMALAWRQTLYWRDNETIWLHTLACTSNNYFAEHGLGSEYANRGQIDAAITHFQRALAINPDYQIAHYSLGVVLARRGQIDEAIAHFRKAVEIKPNFTEAHINLAIVMVSCGQVDEAIHHFKKALEIKPGYAVVHNNLGIALASRGQIEEAIMHFRRAVEIKPD